MIPARPAFARGARVETKEPKPRRGVVEEYWQMRYAGNRVIRGFKFLVRIDGAPKPEYFYTKDLKPCP